MASDDEHITIEEEIPGTDTAEDDVDDNLPRPAPEVARLFTFIVSSCVGYVARVEAAILLTADMFGVIDIPLLVAISPILMAFLIMMIATRTIIASGPPSLPRDGTVPR